MDVDKERKLAMWVVALDNHIHDVIKSYMTWLPMLNLTAPEFVDYYNKHGIHNIDRVLKF